jgi:hypothetical protein
MIQVPRRSVTRFFIPMIDVLTLLFCIFLLMPIIRENEALSRESDAEGMTPDDMREETELRRQQLAELEQDQRRAQALLAELNEKRRNLIQQNVYVRLLTISPRDGSLTYFDPAGGPKAATRIDSAAAARELIARHQKEAGWRDLLYIFQEPRDTRGEVAPFPTLRQENEYKRWFQAVNFEGCIKPPLGKEAQ